MRTKPCRHNFKDLTSQTFGRLLVVERAPSTASGQARWRCECKCGGTATVDGYYLRRGIIQSCGCLQQERARDASAVHGYVGTPEYNSWRGILRRCTDPKARCYDSHGGRGVQCLWSGYEEFVADMGERPSTRHRMFRLDRDGHFEPANCAWMIPTEYARLYGRRSRNRISRVAHGNSERALQQRP